MLYIFNNSEEDFSMDTSSSADKFTALLEKVLKVVSSEPSHPVQKNEDLDLECDTVLNPRIDSTEEDSSMDTSSSSSSDKFAALLDKELEVASSKLSSKQKDEDLDMEYDNVLNPRIDRIKRHKMGEPDSLCTELASDEVECDHPGSFGVMCFKCGKSIADESGLKLRYIHKDLRLRNDEVARMRNKDKNYILKHKKLYLVLDLDHTLVNSTGINELTADEEYLRNETSSHEEGIKGTLFKSEDLCLMIKLRPYIHIFLKEASKMFDMYIYTMGNHSYAAEVAKLIDPNQEYFVSKVISRDESTLSHKKDLDLLLGQESTVLILDDTEDVWPDYTDNLILVIKYMFFASSQRQFGFNWKSPAEKKCDEIKANGQLDQTLNLLTKIHKLFFDEKTCDDDFAGRDVRQVLKTVRREILKGCKIVFSCTISNGLWSENHHLWKMAERLGATCAKKLDSSVTHVVSSDSRTTKSQWAIAHKKFLVSTSWIECTNYRWQRQPEQNFPVCKVENL